MSLEVWGDEGDLGPELPEGWWDEDTVSDVQAAVAALFSEPIYEGARKENGISVRFLALMHVLKLRAQLASADDPLVAEALAIVGAKV